MMIWSLFKPHHVNEPIQTHCPLCMLVFLHLGQNSRWADWGRKKTRRAAAPFRWSNHKLHSLCVRTIRFVITKMRTLLEEIPNYYLWTVKSDAKRHCLRQVYIRHLHLSVEKHS